jgi:hypothetical protein
MLALPPDLWWLHVAYAGLGKYVVLAVLAALARWMNAGATRPPLFIQLGVTVFVFMSLTPGFGIQYLAWLVPWVAGLGLAATVLCGVAGGVFQFLVYNFWAGGLPWFLANSDQLGPWRGPLVYYELLCWVAVVMITALYLATARAGATALSPALADPRRG